MSTKSSPRRNRRSGVEDRWLKADKSHSAQYGTGKRWRARYVDDESREHAKSFTRKADAQKWLDTIVSSQVSGNYIDPVRGEITFASFYKEWSSRQVWVPGTVQAMNLAANGVTFGAVALGDLRPSHIESWVKAMQDKPLEPSTIRTRFNNVRSVLRAAKRDKVLGDDPTERITLPRRRRAEAAMTIPEPSQVGELIRSADDDFRAFVALAAFAGLRLGEAAALQIHDVDFLRREIHVRRQVQRANGGTVEIRAPKYGSERTIPAPDGLLQIVAEHVRLWLPSTDPVAWLFPGEQGHPWHQNSVGYRWRKAKQSAGQSDWHLHDLRHYYASGLIHAGCDVVTVQKALGHSSPNVTLSTYAHLWPNADDRTRKAADAMFTEATADALRTESVEMPADQRV
ncbi:tyrosine-type recombinase/integrase [Rhodococcoides yunnanense]|jgi:integrase|uniref:tyrosine-type recombinase/integrase n=1 Tax=Rhodococcoides yunnanense TaxID=278209 RepID=UPI0022B21742|nr:site-specific integrase [Rhodococcus yunnanensis]MCZ4278603.1 site-specific integrase [Rhodococcus yunnanensis]